MAPHRPSIAELFVRRTEVRTPRAHWSLARLDAGPVSRQFIARLGVRPAARFAVDTRAGRARLAAHVASFEAARRGR